MSETLRHLIRGLIRANGGTGRTSEEEAAFQRGAQTRSEIDDFIRNKDAQEAATGAPPEPNPSPTGGEPVTPPTEQAEIDGVIQAAISVTMTFIVTWIATIHVTWSAMVLSPRGAPGRNRAPQKNRNKFLSLS